MQLSTFTASGAVHVGVLDGRTLVSLERASGGDPRFASMLDLVQAGDAAVEAARELAESHPASAAYDVDAVTLLAPLPATVPTGPGGLVRPAPGGDLPVGLVGVVGRDAGLVGATLLSGLPGAQGPVLTTADELGSVLGPAARIEVRVNGAVRCRTTVPGVLAELERVVAATPHRPGSLVVLDLPLPVEPDAHPFRDGDEVEVEMTGLGLLRNRIQL